MIICVNTKDQKIALECLAKSGETAWIIGRIDKGEKDLPGIEFI